MVLIVAGIDKYFLARMERAGYRSELVFQNSKGSCSVSLSPSYFDTSSSAFSVNEIDYVLLKDRMITSLMISSNLFFFVGGNSAASTVCMLLCCSILSHMFVISISSEPTVADFSHSDKKTRALNLGSKHVALFSSSNCSPVYLGLKFANIWFSIASLFDCLMDTVQGNC